MAPLFGPRRGGDIKRGEARRVTSESANHAIPTSVGGRVATAPAGDGRFALACEQRSLAGRSVRRRRVQLGGVSREVGISSFAPDLDRYSVASWAVEAAGGGGGGSGGGVGHHTRSSSVSSSFLAGMVRWALACTRPPAPACRRRAEGCRARAVGSADAARIHECRLAAPSCAL
jgi:hypothetical protein